MLIAACTILLSPTYNTALPSIEESRQVIAPHSHRPQQWLLDFQPLGFVYSLSTGIGYQSKLALSYMLSRNIALGGNLENQRTGFGVNLSEPPSYHHLRAKRIHAFASFGLSRSRLAIFGNLGFGYAFLAENVSNFNVIESVWPSHAISTYLSVTGLITVHPALSLGIELRTTIDLPLGGEPYSKRLISPSVTPVFRVHL